MFIELKHRIRCIRVKIQFCSDIYTTLNVKLNTITNIFRPLETLKSPTDNLLDLIERNAINFCYQRYCVSTYYRVDQERLTNRSLGGRRGVR